MPDNHQTDHSLFGVTRRIKKISMMDYILIMAKHATL
jgi:hypothetical protein